MDDLARLNEGGLASAPLFVPPMSALLPPPPAPMLPERPRGSVVLDDLLLLNPIRIAAADDTGVGAAAAALAAAAPATDARLQQKVVVHADSQRLADVLAGLARTTGVSLIARTDVASDSVSVWAENRTLMEVMRDLRHLHGYYWSRSKRGDAYVYSLWQDAQSRASEEAEAQRWALEQQQEFEADVWKHVQALDAPEATLKKLGQDDPFLIAQMTNPVTRGAFRLFAALSPDQQAVLLKGQTPSTLERSQPDVSVFPREGRPGETYREPPEQSVAQSEPRGDIVTLRVSEMTPRQRAVLSALFPRAAAHLQQRGEYRRRLFPTLESGDAQLAQAVSAADPATATVTLFRWGDVNYQGLSLRIAFQSSGREWLLYSNFEVPALSRQFYSDRLRRGEFRFWESAQAEIDRLLGRGSKGGAAATSTAREPAAPSTRPDPILDAPISITWPLLPEREPSYMLDGDELLALLHRDLRRPLVLDGLPKWLAKRPGEGPVFRMEKRPLRELLERLFPGWEYHTSEGALFLTQPDRIRWRLNATPPAVREFLNARRGPLTLDDLVLVARSLSPWQVAELRGFFSPEAREQILAVQELLQLYGEMAPSQRSGLSLGVPFSRMTPTQQALFLAFAERQRPFVERERFQKSSLLMTVAPIASGASAGEAWPTARVTFTAQFDQDDAQSFTLDVALKGAGAGGAAADLVGKPFPFPQSWQAMSTIGVIERQPVLADARLRHKPFLLVISRSFAQPYYGTQPPPSLQAQTRLLAERLRDTGILVVHALYGPRIETEGTGIGPATPNLLSLFDPGGQSATVWRGMIGLNPIKHSPTVILVGSDEIVRRVFEWPAAWDLGAIEQAARQLQ